MAKYWVEVEKTNSSYYLDDGEYVHVDQFSIEAESVAEAVSTVKQILHIPDNATECDRQIYTGREAVDIRYEREEYPYCYHMASIKRI